MFILLFTLLFFGFGLKTTYADYLVPPGLRSLQLIEDDDDPLHPYIDPVIYDPQREVTVFEPGPDSFVTAPQGSIRNAMMSEYGTPLDTKQRRDAAMATPKVNLYNNSLFHDPWIEAYGSSGTYQLSYPVRVPDDETFYQTRFTERCSYLAYFQEKLVVVGAWSFCPGPPWRDENLTDVSHFCFYINTTTVPQPWINADLGAPHSYPRGAVGVSKDGGQTWEIIVADPRLARLGSNLVVVNGSDGTKGAALCLVGGTILPPYQVFFANADFPITDSVLCTYDGTNWWENTPLPTPSAEHSLVSIGSSIVVIGGLRPRSISAVALLSYSSDFMVQPPILVSIIASSPCSYGNPQNSACIGYKGWAAFGSPLVPSVNNAPRCNPLVLFTNDIAIPGSINEDSPPQLLIGSGYEMYTYAKPIFFTEGFLDMYHIQNVSLESNIFLLANKVFDSDPLLGTRDTFNTTVFMQLGDWIQDERQLPQISSYTTSFLHQITFAPGADICGSSGLFTGDCRAIHHADNHTMAIHRPYFVYIIGQSLFSDLILSLTNDPTVNPYKYIAVTQLMQDADYIENPYLRLETFYGQRVTELPNYGSAFLTFLNTHIIDSILISPPWNEGQPVIFALQGGIRMQAIHFARCTFLNCKYGASYPVTCRYNPRDSYCESCSSCSGNTSADGGTFARKLCSYDISDLSRIPTVTDTLCDVCTNCSALDADYSQTCSASSDAVCKARVIPAPSDPPSADESKNEEFWKSWLFKFIPIERQSGPFLERLRTKPLEAGIALIAILTITFIATLSWISTIHENSTNPEPKKENTSLSHVNSTFENRRIQVTDEVGSVPTSESSISQESERTAESIKSAAGLSLISKRRQLVRAILLSYIGLLFFVTSVTFILSLPIDIVISAVLFTLHMFFSLCGIYTSGMFDSIVDKAGRRRLAYSRQIDSNTSDVVARRTLRIAEIFVVICMLCNPLCIALTVFFPNNLVEVKHGEMFSGLTVLFSGLYQLVIVCIAVYQFQLSLFLWPVSLSILTTLTTLMCAGFAISNALSLFNSKTSSLNVAVAKPSSTSTSTTTSSVASKLNKTNDPAHLATDIHSTNEIVVTHSSGNGTEENISSSANAVTIEAKDAHVNISQETDDYDTDNDDFDSNQVLEQLKNRPDANYGEIVTSFSQQLAFENDIQNILDANYMRQYSIKQSQIRRASAPPGV